MRGGGCQGGGGSEGRGVSTSSRPCPALPCRDAGLRTGGQSNSPSKAAGNLVARLLAARPPPPRRAARHARSTPSRAGRPPVHHTAASVRTHTHARTHARARARTTPGCGRVKRGRGARAPHVAGRAPVPPPAPCSPPSRRGAPRGTPPAGASRLSPAAKSACGGERRARARAAGRQASCKRARAEVARPLPRPYRLPACRALCVARTRPRGRGVRAGGTSATSDQQSTQLGRSHQERLLLLLLRQGATLHEARPGGAAAAAGGGGGGLSSAPRAAALGPRGARHARAARPAAGRQTHRQPQERLEWRRGRRHGPSQAPAQGGWVRRGPRGRRLGPGGRHSRCVRGRPLAAAVQCAVLPAKGRVPRRTPRSGGKGGGRGWRHCAGCIRLRVCCIARAGSAPPAHAAGAPESWVGRLRRLSFVPLRPPRRRCCLRPAARRMRSAKLQASEPSARVASERAVSRQGGAPILSR